MNYTAAYLGAVARCVEDAARIQLLLSGPECLAMALAKIAGRRGGVVRPGNSYSRVWYSPR